MDAFSLSIADGLNEPQMKKRKMLGIAFTFSLFQFGMPMLGWVCVHTLVEKFNAFRYAIPWIALILLSFIGGKMIYEYLRSRKKVDSNLAEKKTIGFFALALQGIATSIDALSVGFTIADYQWNLALYACALIAIVTFFFCIVGVIFGKKISLKFSSYAELIGGFILIGIGVEIFISNMLELYR
ncbi:MAG: manganese efflux pump MntP family protein [Anaeroplasmataceae bacterium]|nr:manganese efflux pump MntP family protein [Anaeroplasmataceae bacterium]